MKNIQLEYSSKTKSSTLLYISQHNLSSKEFCSVRQSQFIRLSKIQFHVYRTLRRDEFMEIQIKSVVVGGKAGNKDDLQMMVQGHF